MRSLVFACVSVAALLGAAPAFANCSAEIARVERSMTGLHSGPNTRAAARELERARASRSEKVCRNHIRQASAYAERSARADRRGHRVRTATVPRARHNQTARLPSARYDERPN